MTARSDLKISGAPTYSMKVPAYSEGGVENSRSTTSLIAANRPTRHIRPHKPEHLSYPECLSVSHQILTVRFKNSVSRVRITVCVTTTTDMHDLSHLQV